MSSREEEFGPVAACVSEEIPAIQSTACGATFHCFTITQIPNYSCYDPCKTQLLVSRHITTVERKNQFRQTQDWAGRSALSVYYRRCGRFGKTGLGWVSDRMGVVSDVKRSGGLSSEWGGTGPGALM